MGVFSSGHALATLLHAAANGPALPDVPPAPDEQADAAATAKAAEAAARAQRAKAGTAAARGYASTLLTGPSGDSTPAPVAYKTLLGQ